VFIAIIVPRPTRTDKRVKKRTAPFIRQESERYTRLGSQNTWRKPRGIDSRVRRRFKGQRPQVKIGYRSDARTRFTLPNHFKKFRVNVRLNSVMIWFDRLQTSLICVLLFLQNTQDLELLMMHNGSYAAQIAKTVSARKRKEIIERALQLDIKILNAHARVRTAEQE